MFKRFFSSKPVASRKGPVTLEEILKTIGERQMPIICCKLEELKRYRVESPEYARVVEEMKAHSSLMEVGSEARLAMEGKKCVKAYREAEATSERLFAAFGILGLSEVSEAEVDAMIAELTA